MPAQRCLAIAASLLAASCLATLSGCLDFISEQPGLGHPCQTDADCAGSPQGPICHPSRKVCVECAVDAHCMGKGTRVKCDLAPSRCVECTTSSHCMPGNACVASRCAPGCDADAPCPKGRVCDLPSRSCVGCLADPDCAATSQKCDIKAHLCVECVIDRDCAAGKVCRKDACVPGCTFDQHCPMGKVCDLPNGQCVDCAVDGDCKSPGAPRCDTHNHACVSCLPDPGDNCPIGRYCGPGFVCAPGCRADPDCQVGMPSPAAQGMPRCNGATHACVACLGDADCPKGKVCGTDHTCTSGCNGDGQCGTGESCCGGQCQSISTSAHCGSCGVVCAGGEGCCTGSCTSLKTGANCGACGVQCAVGQACCGGLCVNALLDTNHCGGCGTVCPSGQICCSGSCKAFNKPGVCVDCTKACLEYGVTGQDFAKGTYDQLKVDGKGLTTVPASDDPSPAKAPHVWIANHTTQQVSKVDEATGALLGTFPSGGGNPSRGAMAFDGTYWVGHRGQNCDVNDPNCSNVAHILLDGKIGCKVGKAQDGAPMPFVRALAIDADGFVWAGTWNDHRLHKIDPDTCKTVADFVMTFNGQDSSPYGLAIDGKGQIWNSSLGSGPTLAFDIKTSKFVRAVAVPYQSYGITADKKGNVYMGLFSPPYDGILRIDAATYALTVSPGTPAGYQTRGMSVDTDGNVWAAWQSRSCDDNCGTAYAAKFAAGTGVFLGSYGFGEMSNAVAISADSWGNVWLAGYLNGKSAYGALRFPRGIKMDNQRDFITKFDGGYPYTYSDFTGIVLRTVTSNNAQDGTWIQAFDGQLPATQWTGATFAATTPKGTAVKLRFAAAPSFGELKTAPVCGPFTTSPADLTTCKFGPRQWLLVTAELSTNDVNLQPTLTDLKIFFQQ